MRNEIWPGIRHVVIGMLHAPPLPGSPRGRLSLAEIRDVVLRDAETLAAGGMHGLMLENFGDVPFLPRTVSAATVAQMTWLAAEVRRHVDLPLGINVLRNDGLAALAVAAAVGGKFIRVNVLAGARVTDQGIVEGIAHELLRERRALGAEDVKIVAEVAVKHSSNLGSASLAEEAADLTARAGADALIVTGPATGRATRGEDVRSLGQASGGVPLFVGSGVSPQNVGIYLDAADGFIVGTELKSEGIVDNPVDPLRVRALMAELA